MGNFASVISGGIMRLSQAIGLRFVHCIDNYYLDALSLSTYEADYYQGLFDCRWNVRHRTMFCTETLLIQCENRRNHEVK